MVIRKKECFITFFEAEKLVNSGELKNSNKETDLLPTADKSLEWSQPTWWKLKITGMRTMPKKKKKKLRHVFIDLVKISFVLNYLSRGNYSLIILWEKHLLEKVFFQLLLKPNFKLLQKKKTEYVFFWEIYLAVSVFLWISLCHCPPYLSILIGFFFGLRVFWGRNTSTLFMTVFVIDLQGGVF